MKNHLKNLDERSLDAAYIRSAPAYFIDFVKDLFAKVTYLKDYKLPTRHLFQNAAPLFCWLTLNALFSGYKLHIDLSDYLLVPLRKAPPEPDDYSGTSASMNFYAEMLKLLVTQKPRVLPLEKFFETLSEPFLRRALKRRMEAGDLKEALHLMLTYLVSGKVGVPGISMMQILLK